MRDPVVTPDSEADGLGATAVLPVVYRKRVEGTSLRSPRPQCVIVTPPAHLGRLHGGTQLGNVVDAAHLAEET
jgi:hypothetical protein